MWHGIDRINGCQPIIRRLKTHSFWKPLRGNVLRQKLFLILFGNMPEISKQLIGELAQIAQKLSAIAASFTDSTSDVAPEFRERYEQRMAKGVCLNDEVAPISGERLKRGLCPTRVPGN